MRIQLPLALVEGALLLLPRDALMAGGALHPVSAKVRTNITAAGASFAPAFSADGQFVVFLSHARNLVTNDAEASSLNVFVRDFAASNTILVSASITAAGGGNQDSSSPSISSNGQFVAFTSEASDLVNNDVNAASDIFVRDLASRTTTLVSADPSGTPGVGDL